MKTAFFSHPDFQSHQTPRGHPERAARMQTIEDALQASEIASSLARFDFAPASETDLARCHEAVLIERITQMAARGGGGIDADTHVSPASFHVAKLAAGAAMCAVDKVLCGACDNAFVAARPPGHHAETRRAMGFCLFNTIACAARFAQAEHGLERVAILDWDVHHGNGTQQIFYDDASVFFASLHQSPHWPYSGEANETGRGAGEGTTVNIPMRAGCGDDEYETAWRSLEAPLRKFSPQLILISCGFDAHARDPLGGMNVSTNGFVKLMRITRQWAAQMCDNRVVAVLEGGYDLDALADSTLAVVEEMQRDE